MAGRRWPDALVAVGGGALTVGGIVLATANTDRWRVTGSAAALLGGVILVVGIVLLVLRKEPSDLPTTEASRPNRTGVRVRGGGKAKIRNARFGKDLDTGVDVEGEADIEGTDHR